MKENMEDVKKALVGMNFFVVHDGWKDMYICTYRGKKSIENVFSSIGPIFVAVGCEDCEVFNKKWRKPYYCVELSSEYSNVELLAKNIMISRISGLMDKELVGMGAEEVLDEEVDVGYGVGL